MHDVAAILDGLPDGILIVDIEGRIALVNAALQAMTGFAAEEMVGQRVEVLVPEAQRAAHARRREGFSLAPTLRPMNTGIDTRVLSKDGSDRRAEIHISPIPWDGVTGFIAAVRLVD